LRSQRRPSSPARDGMTTRSSTTSRTLDSAPADVVARVVAEAERRSEPTRRHRWAADAADPAAWPGLSPVTGVMLVVDCGGGSGGEPECAL
jgi:hypothetical protein